MEGLSRAPDGLVGSAPPSFPSPKLQLPVIFGPNITGSLRGLYGPFYFANTQYGAFSIGDINPGGRIQQVYEASTGSDKAGFDASNSNAIYSDSVTTVQPPSYQSLMIIKA